MFKRLFPFNTHQTEILLSSLDEQELVETIRSLFTEWQKHDMCKFSSEEKLHCINVEVSKDNVLSLKPCKFACHIVGEDKNENSNVHSKAIFTSGSGSMKTFQTMVDEFRNFLNKESVYIEQ